jgi:hypothetical protein
MLRSTDFEKLGVFYLGRPYDLAAKKPKDGVLLYDSRDLVTHAVCVGMTGSGKTGLCLALLEEAALDGIPALVIDPKGDLPNLMLTFPDLRPEDFAPWINADDAARQGLSPADFARDQAERWRKGLAAWGQDGHRIRRFREAADVAVYTPGSEAGIPVSILTSFSAPSAAVREDGEALSERVSTAAGSLLGFTGIEADPVKSREHILLSTILETAWRQGQDLDLRALIHRIQTPQISKVGVLDLESFYPSRDRFELASRLNNLLAAPSFAAWMSGEALDVGRLLHTPAGKPRIAIFSIAHLPDPERMFFVSLLLNQTISWMRGQSGTTSLRAVLYMDEIFGYFPPVANPPSKPPLLTLLKQARAFGVGVVLATQNPVDLDYKGLSNAGTWFIGRLQTERDRTRVLDGLEGAAAGAAGGFSRQRMEEILGGLGTRIFLMNNVHDDAPEVFETRWAMSYLGGPLTRTQIKMLMDPIKRSRPPGPSLDEGPAAREAVQATASRRPAVTAQGGPLPGADRPVLPPDIPQYVLPLRGAQPEGATLLYQPAVIGAGQVRFVDAKAGLDTTRDVALVAPITADAIAVSWDTARPLPVVVADLDSAPAASARFVELPAPAVRPKSYEIWRRELAAWLHRTQSLQLRASRALKAVSRPDESEGDFRARIQHAGHERRDQAVEQLRQKYAPKVAALQERIRRAEQAVARESEQATGQGLQAAISVGATILGAFLGRKAVSASTLGRATTAARGAGRVLKERQDVGRARETAAALQQQLTDLEAQFQAETEMLRADDASTEPLETVTVRPTKQHITVRLVALCWIPSWQTADGTLTPAW